MPSRVSDGPRELISGMLQVSPERRMSIDEVCCHPWLQHCIPRYLTMPPPVVHDANTHILKVYILPPSSSFNQSRYLDLATYLSIYMHLFALNFLCKFHQVCDDTVESVVRLVDGLDKTNLVELLHNGVENQVYTKTDDIHHVATRTFLSRLDRHLMI